MNTDECPAVARQTQAHTYAHEHLPQLVFKIFRLIEISQVSNHQKQALVNAINYVIYTIPPSLSAELLIQR